ncbi:FecR family protein [Methylobacter sp.]|uniref:FecR family protein n=1 Tax=Methylobacter sp. TaxID=2051955 RepID=UPI002487EB68|nr:FecR family protein [Methylobacter sp.]MDI1276547.1 FecR family protein [Methylobacter sp.]MDI1357225.1 FecR family protein [Methylobacter sp.]
MTDCYDTSSGSVHEQATFWITRLHSGDCTDQERRDFEVWLAQSEVHRIAYREVAEFWEGLSRIEPLAAPQLAAARAYLRETRQSRRALSKKRLAGVLSVVLITGFSPLGWSWLSTDIYRTAKGESTSIQLSDGSRIDLNTDTELSIQYTWTARSVKLERGEALFSVIHNPEKPFEVIAAGGRIQDIGTRFNIYRQADRVSITVLEGEVSVAAKQNATAQNLIPGQQISYDSTGQTSAISYADMTIATAWQKGQLVFKGQPLNSVLEQLGRYHDASLQVPDSRLQSLKVSGVFPTNNLSLALNTIAGALPIKVSQTATTTFVIAPAD